MRRVCWIASCALMAGCFSARERAGDPPAKDDPPAMADEPALSCDERRAMAGDRLLQAAAVADRSCSSDADCDAVAAAVSCYPHCQYAFVSADGRAEIERAKREVDAEVCTKGCRRTPASCGTAPRAECREGRCTSFAFVTAQCIQPLSEVAVGYADAVAGADRSCTSDADCELVLSRAYCHDSCEQATPVARNGREAFEAAVAENREACERYAALGCNAPTARMCERADAGDVACIRGTCSRGPSPDAMPGCVTCFEQPLEWSLERNWTDRIISRLDPCARYSRTRLDGWELASLIECTHDLVACDGSLSSATVLAALSDPEVREAFDRAPIVYGIDGRAGDASIFRFGRGEQRVYVGSQCTSASASCTRVPSGVQALVDLLQLIDQRACAAGD